MKNSGSQGLGDLNSISKEINDVIKDLEEKKYTQSTSNKQKKILSRMLDSQTSMTQRGDSENIFHLMLIRIVNHGDYFLTNY